MESSSLGNTHCGSDTNRRSDHITPQRRTSRQCTLDYRCGCRCPLLAGSLVGRILCDSATRGTRVSLGDGDFRKPVSGSLFLPTLTLLAAAAGVVALAYLTAV